MPLLTSSIHSIVTLLAVVAAVVTGAATKTDTRMSSGHQKRSETSEVTGIASHHLSEECQRMMMATRQDVDESLRRQDRRIQEQDRLLAEQQRTLILLSERVHDLESGLGSSHLTADTTKGVLTSFGCPGDLLTLSCPANKTIFIADASYGQYYQACDAGTCCSPHPFDCIQSMQDNNPTDWAVLKLTCDNQTSCSYLFQGSTFTDDVCTPIDSVAYVDLYYSCLPEDTTETVAFTARSDGAATYAVDDVIQFPVVYTNLGGYYNSDTGIFTCPYDGIYLFFSNIRMDHSRIHCSLMKEETVLPMMFSATESSAANLVVEECARGERVWVRQRDDGTEVSGARAPTFTGYLLHRSVN